MTLRLLGHIDLPPHQGSGGFDHADVHAPTDRLYVAHTANDAIDVIDCAGGRYVESLPGHPGVAGALVSEERNLVFATNRGANTVSVFAPGDERNGFKIGVGVRPNGAAFDARRGTLIVANVGDSAIADSYTVSVIDIGRRQKTAEIQVPGRTRWAVYDAANDAFCINMAAPPRIVVIDGRAPIAIARQYEVPAEGPHGLDLDPATGWLWCACDAGILIAMEAATGRVLGDLTLSGTPDVVFLHHQLGHLYVAIGDPGVIDVVSVRSLSTKEVVATEVGAHTFALDRQRSKLYAFLPGSHRAAVYLDAN